MCVCITCYNNTVLAARVLGVRSTMQPCGYLAHANLIFIRIKCTCTLERAV